MMEIIHSTNITFNGNSNENVGAKKGTVPRKTRSPVESKSPDASPIKSNISSPVKELHGDFPSRASRPPAVANIDSPRHEESPLFKRVHDIPKYQANETPTSWKKRESPADSGIELSPISISPPKINPKLRSMYNNSRREADEGTEFSINPDPVPYQPNNFIAGRNSRLDGAESTVPPSSTMMKKVPVARRHFDTFGTIDWMSGIPKRGMMLHTDRYNWDLAKALDGMSQRERLHAELEYMERLRGIKRRREVLPHRAQLDLLMGGKKVEFNERFQIQREIEKLKSLILPQHAKDLFHGRGFVLPSNHNSVHPRRHFDPNFDLEDELSSPFSPEKYSFNPETGRVQPRNRQYPADQSSSLPKINNKGYLLDNFRAQKGEPIPVKTPNPFSVEMEDTWTPYVTRQSTVISPIGRAGSKSPAVPFSPRRYTMKASESPDLTLYPVSQGLISPRYGSSQPVYMTRSKTNVTNGIQGKPAAGGARSLTAMPAKKDVNVRPTVTAPPAKPIPVAAKPDIKIPVSARDPEEPEVAPESTPVVPKTTPATSKKPDVQEQIEEPGTKDTEGQDGALSASRSVASPVKAQTPNPLKAVELVQSMSQDEQARLKQTFNKLDTDKDGHIMFSQLQTQLPKQFSQAQEKYIKQVYDITSSNTFFGVDEFMTMSYLTSVVTDLTGEPLDAYNKIDFHGLHEVILKYVELYQAVDRTHRGKIALSSLQEILTSALSLDFKAEPPRWNKLIDTIETSESGVISKIEFLAHIPYFQTFVKKK
ncbi:uncharacterized protein LOC132736071 isoform X3 [Ruditapes philippinarum]|uniref:uncharacterized protein LOC132736071 isoform X3 n=1 Tax=Ruditapes philippinarum TaxID=129788 RepID=UPI00295C2137|nr:uncharacterized protein LOC132736071 isoform X3 [Ruditapes philippinarum]